MFLCRGTAASFHSFCCFVHVWCCILWSCAATWSAGSYPSVLFLIRHSHLFFTPLWFFFCSSSATSPSTRQPRRRRVSEEDAGFRARRRRRMALRIQGKGLSLCHSLSFPLPIPLFSDSWYVSLEVITDEFLLYPERWHTVSQLWRRIFIYLFFFFSTMNKRPILLVLSLQVWLEMALLVGTWFLNKHTHTHIPA